MKIISRQEAKNQNIKTYYTGKPCKHGHVSYRYVNDGKCSECVKNRVTKWTADNKDRKKLTDKMYYDDNKSEILQRVSEYKKTNSETIKQKLRVYTKTEKHRLTRKNYVNSNRDIINSQKTVLYYKDVNKHLEQKRNDYEKHKESRKLKNKKYRAENKNKLNSYYVERRDKDVNFKMSCYIRNMLGRILRISSEDKQKDTVSMVGYTHLDLIRHLESLFTKGMCWDNYGEWHIDHIYPVSKFIAKGVTDPRVINALENLQPLWAKDNLSKSNKV